MTAATLQALAADLHAETLEVLGATDQAILTGIVAAAETFGLAHGQERLTAKLRNMDPALRAQLLTKEQA
jgi:hypothetical protein